MTTLGTIGDWDVVETPCARCGAPVRTYWHKDGTGMLTRPAVVPVASQVLHAACWDDLVKQHPIAP